MKQLRMHAGIAYRKTKDVLAGNKPASPIDAYRTLPWVSETQRLSYAVFTASLYPLYAARQMLPAQLRRKLLFFVRGIDAKKSYGAFQSAYTLPEGPSATGSSYELYVCRSRREKYPDLAVRVHKDTEHAAMQQEFARATHAWHEEKLPEFTSWQGSGLISLGLPTMHHITVSEHVHILADICAGHSKSALAEVQEVLRSSGKETQQQFAVLVERMRTLAQQGIYLDIGGMNNIAICTTQATQQPIVRILDTGLIGISNDIPEETRKSLEESGVCMCTVTEKGGNGDWNAEKYNEYLDQLERITRALQRFY